MAMENKRKNSIFIIIGAAVFVVVAVGLMVFRGIDFSKKKTSDSTVMPEATGTTERIENGAVIEQTFRNSTDTISEVGIVFYRIKYLEGVNMFLELYEGNTLLASSIYPVHMIEGEHRTYIVPYSALTGMKDKELTIKVYAEDKRDTGLAIMISEKENATYKYDGVSKKGSLCFSVTE